MQYILRGGPRAFAILLDDTIITQDYTKATQFNSIGEAMRAAIVLNETLDVKLFKVCRL